MEPTAQPTSSTEFSWTDVRLLLVLVGLVVGIRAWQLTHTEVAARDSIGYIRIAWRLEHQELNEVLRASHQHPLFPAAILAMSHLVRPWLPDDLPLAMQVSSQLVSALASVLLIFPLYLLGRQLFDRSIAFAAVLLTECLPNSGRVLGDGLSEGLFLLLSISSLFAVAVGFRRRSPAAFMAAGLAGGAAYLARPEGGLLVAAAGLVLIATTFVRPWRMPMRRLLACGLGLSAAALLVAAPYMITIGGLTVKPSANILLQESVLHDSGLIGTTGEPEARGISATAALFAVWMEPTDLNRYRFGLWAITRAMVVGSFYIGWLCAVLGLWHYRQLFRQPLPWVMLLIVAALSLLLFKIATTLGYLSDRHTLLAVVIGSLWSAAGLEVIGAAIANMIQRLSIASVSSRWAQQRTWPVALLLLLVGLPLERTLATIHYERVGFREAGCWLAHHIEPGDYVDDAYCWSHYFAGRVFAEGRTDLPRHEPPVHYVVLECSGNKHFRLQVRTEPDVLAAGGKLVAHWPVPRGPKTAEIRVYEVPGAMPPPAQRPAFIPAFQRVQGADRAAATSARLADPRP